MKIKIMLERTLHVQNSAQRFNRNLSISERMMYLKWNTPGVKFRLNEMINYAIILWFKKKQRVVWWKLRICLMNLKLLSKTHTYKVEVVLHTDMTDMKPFFTNTPVVTPQKNIIANSYLFLKQNTYLLLNTNIKTSLWLRFWLVFPWSLISQQPTSHEALTSAGRKEVKNLDVFFFFNNLILHKVRQLSFVKLQIT